MRMHYSGWLSHAITCPRTLALIKTPDKTDHCIKPAPGNLNHNESQIDQNDIKDLNKMSLLLSLKNHFFQSSSLFTFA